MAKGIFEILVWGLRYEGVFKVTNQTQQQRQIESTCRSQLFYDNNMLKSGPSSLSFEASG